MGQAQRKDTRHVPDWVTTPLEDAEPSEAWAALAGAATRPNPLLAPGALLPFASLGQPGARLLRIRDEGRLVGLVPLAPARGYAKLPVRHTQSFVHPHLLDATPLVAAGEEAAFARGLFAWLDADEGAGRFLPLSRLSEGAVSDALAAVAAEEGRGFAVTERYQRPLLALDPGKSWDDVLAAEIGPKTRKAYRRLGRRLAERGEVTLAVAAPGEPARPWLDRFFAAEHASWKGREGSSLAARPAEAAAFAALAEAAHARGGLRIAELQVDGQPIAHAVDLLQHPGGFALKTAFDEAWSAYSPGFLLEMRLIEDALVRAAGGLAWLDSCAAPGHPTLSRIWPGRQGVLQVLIERRGRRNAAAFRGVRALELLSAARRRL